MPTSVAVGMIFLAGAFLGYAIRNSIPRAQASIGPITRGCMVSERSLATGQSCVQRPGPGSLHLTDLPASSLTSCIEAAVQRRTITGGVLTVTAPGALPYVKAVGCDVAGRSIRTGTIFDVASLTKVMVTAPLILHLVARGAFTLETPIRRWFPRFSREMGAITVGQLLTHTSGLPAGLSRPVSLPPENTIGQEALRRAPGKTFEYSDLGYVLLGRIIERETNEPLDRAAKQLLFDPAGMKETSFNPEQSLRARIACTRGEHREFLCGIVQDPLSRSLGGVAGNAGLFTTVHDLAIYAELLLGHGSINNHRVLPSLVVRYLTEPNSIDPRVVRGYGMDVLSPFSSPKGDLLPFGSFGHTGYSGCSLWIDPQSGTTIIFLSSGKTEGTQKDLNQVRRTIANLVAGALSFRSST